jgi:drug/metabolite transporter (DMT)-like permease
LKEVSVSFLIAYRAVFTFLLSFLLCIHFEGISAYYNSNLLRISLGSIFGTIGLFSMLTVIKKSPLQWLGIYNLIGIIFTTTYLWLFEEIHIDKSILGLLTIIIGFCYYLYGNRSNETTISYKQHLTLLLMTFSFCISGLIHWKNLSSNTPPLLIISNQELVVLISSLIFTFRFNRMDSITNNLKNYFIRVIVMATIIFLALWCSFLGLKITNPVISSVLFLSNPLVTILLAAVFFKEKLTLSSSIAIIIISVGAFILHYFSV